MEHDFLLHAAQGFAAFYSGPILVTIIGEYVQYRNRRRYVKNP